MLRAGGAEVVLSSFATLHDLNLDYSQDLSEELSASQQRELFALLHFTPGLRLSGIFDGLRRYNRILRELAVELGTGWVDNADQIPHDEAYFVDRVHFSPLGAGLMANNFLPIAIELLSRFHETMADTDFATSE